MLFNIIIIRLTCYWIFAKSKCKCMAMSFCNSREISSFQNCPIVIILTSTSRKIYYSKPLYPKKPSFFSSKYPFTGKYHYEYVKLCVVKVCWVNSKAFVSFTILQSGSQNDLIDSWRNDEEESSSTSDAVSAANARWMTGGGSNPARNLSAEYPFHKNLCMPPQGINFDLTHKRGTFFPSCSTYTQPIFSLRAV